ncbi:right-handed parallel beta-helix repeat-containing protein [Actinoplanes sp. NPDC026623]|uniref:right-handed parallel beta-helix repeat-containing protein n=1 Tax=Actinoplanes sp. NPDC026623 TaxID=3155610 RepID=UPI0033DD6B26
MLAVVLPLLGLSACTRASTPEPRAAYTLAPTVSPAPLTAAGCAADPLCAPAPAPVAGDNHPALKTAIAAAATRAVPAVVDAGGTVLTPPRPATVLLAPGNYALGDGLRLPPNVDLRGSGLTATTLSMITSSWANFNYGFLVRPQDDRVARPSPGSTNLVADLTVNGNCREGAGAPVQADLPARPGELCDFRARTGAGTNAGGGITVAARWTVRQVRFTNLEYFKLWLHDAEDVHIVDNRFDNWGGAESGDEDNIGGGGRHDGAVIEYNQFDRTIRGNGIDFTNAIRPVIRANAVYADRAVAAARGVTGYGDMYLEGVPEATVTGNVMHGGHIILQSNSKYAHTGTNKDVTNPRDSTVSDNRLLDSFGAGLTIVYDDYADADGTFGTAGAWATTSTDPKDHVVRPGGGNIVRNNVIVRPAESGVLVAGVMDRVKTAADTVTGNSIVDAGSGGSTAMSTGAGTFETSGVGVSIGDGDRIYGNSVTDDQPAPTTWYGIHLGARNARSTVKNTVLTGPAGEPNTAAGVIGVLLRHAAAAALAPGSPTVDGPVLTWAESVPAGNAAIAGYRVYRAGRPVADLPVGSPAIPANLVAEADAGVEADAAGWTAGSNTTVAHYAGAGALGSGSLSLTAVAAGSVYATGRLLPITAGQRHTAVSSYRVLVGSGQRSRAGIEYYDAGGVRISRLHTQNYASVDNAGNWITSSLTSTAPPNAAYAKAFVLVDNAAAGDVHLVDRIGIVAGTATEQWTDPAAAAAGTAYRVLAYRQGDGQPGWMSSATAP